MANERRQYRVGEKIREILATELLRDKNEKLRMLSIRVVRMSPDLRYASIYYLPLGNAVSREEAEQLFEEHGKRLRQNLAKPLGIRFVPELRFFYDETQEEMDRVAALLARARIS